LAFATPWIAALLLSVAQEVNRICLELPARRQAATRRLAWAIASAATCAASYIELGLKYSVVRYGTIAS
jgi:hypothetical protein